MAAQWIELVSGLREQKALYRQSKARIRRLPDNYRDAADALERYLFFAGGIAQGEAAVRMHGDLADLFEQAAADSVPIREIVGHDPVEFAEAFIANYSDGRWINKERDRLIAAIDRVAAGKPSDGDEG